MNEAPESDLCAEPGRHPLRRREEHREAIEWLLPRVERRLEILSPDLEPFLFDRPRLQQILRERIASHPRLRIRILIRDVGEALRRGHRLVDVAREFPSYAAIRQLGEDFRETLDESYVLIDACCCLYRQPLTGYAGELCCGEPGRLRSLRARFDELWEHGETPTELRRLYL